MRVDATCSRSWSCCEANRRKWEKRMGNTSEIASPSVADESQFVDARKYPAALASPLGGGYTNDQKHAAG